MRELALRDDPRDRLRAQLARALLRRDDHRRATIVQLGRVARGDRASRLECWLKLREQLEAGLARRLVLADHRHRTFSARHPDGHYLGGKGSPALRPQRPPVLTEPQTGLTG